MWAAVTIYALASVLFVFGVVFRKELLVSAAFWVAVAGLLPHTAAIALRWVQVGHGPYLGFFEIASSFAWGSIVVLALVSWRNNRMRVLGVVLAPSAVLLLGGAMLAPRSPLRITAKLASYWLNIHVAFAKLSYMSFIAAFAVGLIYLYRERRGERPESMLSRLPEQDVLDDLSYRFVAVGFIFLSFMIVAGAIWANEAWGRYWAWDPIETWSLISWIVYAGYLHARLTLGWRGRKAAWYAVTALPIVLFTLLGVPIAYHSIHSVYLVGR
jgi:cytochrome c-type biogenesis protein CcsB